MELYGSLTGSSLTADDSTSKFNREAVRSIAPQLLRRFAFRVPAGGSGVIAVSNVGVIAESAARSRSAVAISPVSSSRMAVAASDTNGNVIVSTTEDNGTTWRSTTMSRSVSGIDFFNAQNPSVEFDSKGRLSVVYSLSNMNDDANAIALAESIDDVNFNPPFAITLHKAGDHIIDSHPVIAIGSGGRFIAWENLGSQINVVRSEESGSFDSPMAVVTDALVSGPTITVGSTSVYIGWDEWGFNASRPYKTGVSSMMASSPLGAQLTFSVLQLNSASDIGVALLRTTMLPGL